MATAAALVFIILMLVAALYFWRSLVRKALREVVSVFRERGATDATRATTLEGLGLVQRGILGRVFRRRDYRPQALRLLGQENVIRTTEEGRLYLSEDALEHSQLKRFAKID
jgi:hypothetical protein